MQTFCGMLVKCLKRYIIALQVFCARLSQHMSKKNKKNEKKNYYVGNTYMSRYWNNSSSKTEHENWLNMYVLLGEM